MGPAFWPCDVRAPFVSGEGRRAVSGQLSRGRPQHVQAALPRVRAHVRVLPHAAPSVARMQLLRRGARGAEQRCDASLASDNATCRYVNHFQALQEMGAEPHLNTCFRHFILFVAEFDLIEQQAPHSLSSRPTRAHTPP
eukprot:1555488-Pleurochrysis_carterae.AAC.4